MQNKLSKENNEVLKKIAPKILKIFIVGFISRDVDAALNELCSVLPSIGTEALTIKLESFIGKLGTSIDIEAFNEASNDYSQNLFDNDQITEKTFKQLAIIKVKRVFGDKVYINILKEATLNDYDWLVSIDESDLNDKFCEKVKLDIISQVSDYIDQESIVFERDSFWKRFNIFNKTKLISKEDFVEGLFQAYIKKRKELTELYCRENPQNAISLLQDFMKATSIKLNGIEEKVDHSLENDSITHNKLDDIKSIINVPSPNKIDFSEDWFQAKFNDAKSHVGNRYRPEINYGLNENFLEFLTKIFLQAI